MSNLEALACNLLGCGPADLSMLERVGYDWPDVIEETGWRGSSFSDMSFKSLMMAVVQVGLDHIEDARRSRIGDLEALEKSGDINEDELDELFALYTLDPNEDIQQFHNFLDTSIWFERNASLYRKYLRGAIDDFADNVGIEITGEEESE